MLRPLGSACAWYSAWFRSTVGFTAGKKRAAGGSAWDLGLISSCGAPACVLYFFNSQLFTTPPRLLKVTRKTSVSMTLVSSAWAATAGPAGAVEEGGAVSSTAAGAAGAVLVDAGGAVSTFPAATGAFLGGATLL